MFVSTMWLPSTTRDRWCGRHPMVGCVACSGCVPCGCFGGYSVRETPGPIPNPVVKPYHADGTARGIWWESRTLPDFIYCLWLPACMAGSHKHMYRHSHRDLSAASWTTCPGGCQWCRASQCEKIGLCQILPLLSPTVGATVSYTHLTLPTICSV